MFFNIQTFKELQLTIALIDERFNTRKWKPSVDVSSDWDKILIALETLIFETAENSDVIFQSSQRNEYAIMYNSLLLKSMNELVGYIDKDLKIIGGNRVLDIFSIIDGVEFKERLRLNLEKISFMIESLNNSADLNMWEYANNLRETLVYLATNRNDYVEMIRDACMLASIEDSIIAIENNFEVGVEKVDMDNTESLNSSYRKVNNVNEFVERLKFLNEMDDESLISNNSWLDLGVIDYGLYEVLEKYLIVEGDRPHPNHEVMDLLEENGIRVGPGEVDSFGWLTGVIHLSGNRKILFG